MKEAKTINILGDTQRQQWHSIVNVIRLTGQIITPQALSDLCDELDRYIDFAEDIFEKMDK